MGLQHFAIGASFTFCQGYTYNCTDEDKKERFICALLIGDFYGTRDYVYIQTYYSHCEMAQDEKAFDYLYDGKCNVSDEGVLGEINKMIAEYPPLDNPYEYDVYLREAPEKFRGRGYICVGHREDNIFHLTTFENDKVFYLHAYKNPTSGYIPVADGSCPNPSQRSHVCGGRVDKHFTATTFPNFEIYQAYTEGYKLDSHVLLYNTTCNQTTEEEKICAARRGLTLRTFPNNATMDSYNNEGWGPLYNDFHFLYPGKCVGNEGDGEVCGIHLGDDLKYKTFKTRDEMSLKNQNNIDKKPDPKKAWPSHLPKRFSLDFHEAVRSFTNYEFNYEGKCKKTPDTEKICAGAFSDDVILRTFPSREIFDAYPSESFDYITAEPCSTLMFQDALCYRKDECMIKYTKCRRFDPVSMQIDKRDIVCIRELINCHAPKEASKVDGGVCVPYNPILSVKNIDDKYRFVPIV